MATYAVVLAAGKGSRLKSVSDTPKPLIEVQGRPLSHHIISNLSSLNSLDKVFVVTGHKAAEVEKSIREAFSDQMDKIEFFRQTDLNGTGGAVLSLIKELDLPVNDFLLVLNADDSWKYDRTELMELVGKQRADDIALLITPDRDGKYDYYRKIIIDNYGQVQQFTDAPRYGNHIVCGAYMSSIGLLKRLISIVKEEQDKGQEIGLSTILGYINPKNLNPINIPYSHWHGINTPEELDAAT